MTGHGDGLTTMLFGLDAACYAVLERLGDGELPSIQGLAEAGVSAPLRSQIPPWTPSAWPSIYTGMNPGKHGIFDFLAFDGYDWDVVNATHCRERPVWELLSMQGFTSVVVNAPVTHPPRPFDGALVPGYLAPEAPDCHPAGLFDQLESRLGPYRLYTDRERDPTDLVVARGEAFLYLAERFDPDFGFVQFQQTDTVFHERPDDWEAIREVYRAVDAEIGRIVDALAPSTVLIVSDHGIGPMGGVEFRVNDFLSDTGYVKTVRGGRGMPDWSVVRDDQLRAGESADRRHREVGLLERVGGFGARLGLTTQRVGGALDRAGLLETVARFVPSGLRQAGATQVDFPRSSAFMRSRTECGIRINLAGREPDGIVEPGEYDAVRDRLIEVLRTVETPAGERLFECVLPREAVYRGPFVDRAVDVVTVPAGFDHFLSATIRGTPIGRPSEPWNHKLDGIVIGCGEAITAADHIEGGNLFDIAPTILATFGVAADVRMDGRCLPPVDPAGRRDYGRPDRREPARTADAAVTERLTDLGYLEEA